MPTSTRGEGIRFLRRLQCLCQIAAQCSQTLWVPLLLLFKKKKEKEKRFQYTLVKTRDSRHLKDFKKL